MKRNGSAYYSINGSRVPNPYVDNAKPAPGGTWATVDGRHQQVILDVVRGTSGLRFAAHPEDYANELVGYGIGPSYAIRNLDKILSEDLTPDSY